MYVFYTGPLKIIPSEDKIPGSFALSLAFRNMTDAPLAEVVGAYAMHIRVQLYDKYRITIGYAPGLQIINIYRNSGHVIEYQNYNLK
ncbi:MAG: hypothetical protein Q8908_09660 [Bacteroidota bacterium]|nr:hypothetical protein [Bacteroidota bacterium]